jgi:hypothetical protein
MQDAHFHDTIHNSVCVRTSGKFLKVLHCVHLLICIEECDGLKFGMNEVSVWMKLDLP